MNIELLPEKIEKLESVFLNILYLKPEERIISPDMTAAESIKVSSFRPARISHSTSVRFPVLMPWVPVPLVLRQ